MLSEALLSQVLLNALTAASMYALMALGFNMIFGILRVINFAHGEFYMLGAFLVYYLFDFLGLNYFVSIGLAGVVLFVGGIGVEKLLFHRLRHDETRSMILALGLSIALQNVGLIIWGPEDQSVREPISGILQLGQVVLPMERLMVVGSTILIIGLFYLFLGKTTLGLALQAMAQDEDTAKLQGIHTKRIYAFGFGLGTALAAIAGGLMGPIYALSPFMGSLPLIKAFVVVILGGLGSIPGAILGSLVLAVGESFATTFLGSAASDMVGFVLVIVILLSKPSGLLGEKEA